MPLHLKEIIAQFCKTLKKPVSLNSKNTIFEPLEENSFFIRQTHCFQIYASASSGSLPALDTFLRAYSRARPRRDQMRAVNAALYGAAYSGRLVS